MNKRFLFTLCLLILLCVAGAAAVVHAQTASPTPAADGGEAGIVFPIPELGDCADMGSCMGYCEDPVNSTSCIAYAKEKGFYKDDVVAAAPDEFWNKAQTALGCNSRETCETVCQDVANQSKCHEFAVDQSLVGGYVLDPQEEAVLAAAQTALGCDSAQACTDFCADSANAQACDAFAGQVGLRGGDQRTGPGGCTSEGTCQSYCSDPGNYGECAEFAPDGGQFRGPGGCGNQQECRSYCESNPAQCRTYAPGSNGVYVPVSCPSGQNIGPDGACTASELTDEAGACDQAGQFWNGSACQETPPPGVLLSEGAPFFEPREDMGGCQTPAECYDYCSGNAASCAGFNAADHPRPPETYTPNVYVTPGTLVRFEPREDLGGCSSPGGCYDYCRDNPASCSGFDANSPRPLDVYVPGVYHTPPSNYPYFTPSYISFYVTPIYATPPEGSNYTTPSYYTPGMYTTPHYFTPSDGGNYVTPNYYTPGQYYSTPTDGNYPTPTYTTPRYYTPPTYANYTTPTYYTPPTYVTPNYYTPGFGSNYTTPTYTTPAEYTTPSYVSPQGAILGLRYSSPSYYTPPTGSNYTTPTYASPSYYTPGGYYTPSYTTPSGGNSYVTPVYYSPGSGYATPTYYTPAAGSNYTTPNYPSPQYYSPSYASPSYYTPPAGSAYTSPSYYTPYSTPGTYATPTYYTPPSGSSYTSPSYFTPSSTATSSSYVTPPSGSVYTSPYYSPGVPSAYASPSYPSPTSGSYPTPSGSYSYPTPSSGTYGTPSTSPSYSYPTPSGSYSYPTPSSGSYGTPSTSTAYSTPPSYATPADSYATPSYGSPYGTPESYSTPYGTPESYSSPPEYSAPSGGVQGARSDSFFYQFLRLLGL